LGICYRVTFVNISLNTTSLSAAEVAQRIHEDSLLSQSVKVFHCEGAGQEPSFYIQSPKKIVHCSWFKCLYCGPRNLYVEFSSDQLIRPGVSGTPFFQNSLQKKTFVVKKFIEVFTSLISFHSLLPRPDALVNQQIEAELPV